MIKANWNQINAQIILWEIQLTKHTMIQTSQQAQEGLCYQMQLRKYWTMWGHATLKGG